MIRQVSLAAIVALAVPQLAVARPARIRVFEADARAQPRREAPVVQRFVEGTEVSVDEEGNGDWRRVRLQDGGTGWIEDAALTFAGAAALAPVSADAAGMPGVAVPAPAGPAAPAVAPSTAPAAGGARPPPDLRPHIYVKDVHHLAELMQKDPGIGERARSLSTKQTTAAVLYGVGFAAFVAGVVTTLAMQDLRWAGAGAAAGLVLIPASAVVRPGRGDLLDVVNDWNRAYPAEQFELEREARIGH